MVYRKYGQTGKDVSLLGMGGSRFHDEKCAVEAGMEEYTELVLKAWQNGINYFDTAPGYSNGKSEEIFGRAFQQIHGDFFISTKSTVTVDHTADEMRKRLEQSLQRMHVNKIHFYHMWNILNLEQYQQVIKKGGPLEGALKAKEEGLIDHICFSSHCTGEGIATIIRDGYFEGVTLGYNAVNFKYREEGLKAAKQAGIGVAVMNPLGGGVIPATPDIFHFLKENDYTIAQSALRFAASQEGVTTVLSGFENEKEMHENLKAFNTDAIQSVQHNAELKAHLIEKFDHLCTGCQYCAGCPKGIDPYKLMLSYNQYYLRGKDPEKLRFYLFDSWIIPPDEKFDCVECGRCEQKCTQHLPIVNRIKEINQFADSYIKEQKQLLKVFFEDSKTVKTGIYAIGPYAERLFEKYRKYFGEIDFPVWLFDSDSRKWGTEPLFEGVQVQSPEEILQMGIEKLIITSANHFKEIYEELRYLEDHNIKIMGFEK